MLPIAQRRMLAWLLLAVLACASGGCGGSSTGQPAGKVSWSQQPAGGAELAFQSISNPDDLFLGRSSGDGTYHVTYRALDGLPIGRYKVTITIYTLPKGGAPFPPGEKANRLKEEGQLIPVVYEFEQDIAGGKNAIDFDLSDDKKQKTSAR